MKFELADEHHEFAGVVDDALTRSLDPSTIRSQWIDDDTAADTSSGGRATSAVTAELGIDGLTVPEQLGGSGLPVSDCVLVIEALGRHLMPEPIAETVAVVVPTLLENAHAFDVEPILSSIAASEMSATIQSEWDGWAPWAATADIALVADGDDVVVVQPSADTVDILRGVDPSRRPARIQRDATELQRLPGAAPAMRRRAATASALQASGVADALLEQSVSYAREREQFDRPIGSFQAIKHQLADAFVQIHTARRTAWWAAWCHDTDQPQAREAASVAKAMVGEAAVGASKVALQVHGGIGYTWDCDLHFWMKRAEILDSAWGTSHDHWRELSTIYFGNEAAA